MPLSKYNHVFGGKKGSATKAKHGMEEYYGEGKGEEVFYATVNKAKSRKKRKSQRSRRF